MSKISTQESYVDLPGGQVYVKKWIPDTNEDSLPLILLHNSLGSVGQWRDFPEHLCSALSRRIIAYDRLGFGKSDSRETLPTIAFIDEEATRFFPAIKEQLSIQNYLMLGHSVAGGMAITIAASDEDCKAVITVSSQAFVEDLTVKGIHEAMELFEQTGQKKKLEKWHGDKTEWVLHAWADVWLSDEFKDWSLEPVIHEVTCPVLALHGDRDEYGSAAFPKFIAERSGGKGTMKIITDCGHMPHKEKPDVVIRTVSDFIDRIRP